MESISYAWTLKAGYGVNTDSFNGKDLFYHFWLTEI